MNDSFSCKSHIVIFIQLTSFSIKFTNNVLLFHQKIEFPKIESQEFHVKNGLNICQVAFLKNKPFCSIFQGSFDISILSYLLNVRLVVFLH